MKLTKCKVAKALHQCTTSIRISSYTNTAGTFICYSCFWFTEKTFSIYVNAFLNSVIIKSFCVSYAINYTKQKPAVNKCASICEKRRLFRTAVDIENKLCFISCCSFLIHFLWLQFQIFSSWSKTIAWRAEAHNPVIISEYKGDAERMLVELQLFN